MEFCSAVALKCIGKLTIMTKEEMIEATGGIVHPFRQRETLYAIADELGIKYKRNSCPKCAKDLWNIIREELGLIESAAEESDFNGGDYEWVYLPKRPQYWNGHVIDQDTPVEIIREFVKRFPKGYYRKAEKTTEQSINNQE